MYYIFAVLILSFLAGVTWLSISLASQERPGDIRTIWYIFSLSLFLTILIAVHALSQGAIDGDGKFVGPYGEALSKALEIALDIKGELIFMLLFLAAIIIPQVMSYFLSGISGCASSPIFVSKGFSIFIWTMAKAFATCSAIILSLCLLGALGYIPLGFGEIITSLYTGLAMLFFAFSMMFFYRKSEYLQELAMDYLINKSNVLTKMHRWLARKNIA